MPLATQPLSSVRSHHQCRFRVRLGRFVLLARQPNRRFATVEEIGALAVFLASEAAASITGIALPVDGGWTAHWNSARVTKAEGIANLKQAREQVGA